jgi:trimethylamine--corrinoid protein Co-methyltransferase
MVDALVAWAELGQAIAMTPFLLAGATAPLGVASGLALQTAEALSGIVLAQVTRPGTPCLFGSFYSSVDMRTGGPAFGTPDSVLATVAGVQLARRYGVPIRAGGGLCTGIALDGQAVAETLNSLWATFLAAPDLVLHAAGWMEGGLVTCYEKLAIDLELLRMFGDLRGGVPVDDEHLAFDSIMQEGPGGIFLGSSHTYERFREWSFSSPLFRAQAYPNWQRQGSKTIVEHAHQAWKDLLAGYEDPGIDDAVDEELREFVERRRGDEGE